MRTSAIAVTVVQPVTSDSDSFTSAASAHLPSGAAMTHVKQRPW